MSQVSAQFATKIATFLLYILAILLENAEKSPTFVTNICLIFEFGEVQRNINLIKSDYLIDFVKSFLTSIWLRNLFGFDTAENESSKVR